ncbi:MAG TPA: hypothetical protein VF070_17970 [Streptosporangiaceae bacterium]
MVVPLYARSVAAVIGGLLVLVAWASAIRTLVVPRPEGPGLTRWVARIVDGAYRRAAGLTANYEGRDRVLAGQAAAILLAQLAAWLGTALIGFWLLMWPLEKGGIGAAFTAAGSSMFTLGFNEPTGAPPSVVVFAAAVTGLVTVTLQIAYLPTLYSAFNRRETEVTLLTSRAGVPSWGPELLARTHYALGTGISALDTLPELYAQWERWAADVTESHTTYPSLTRFRSPRPLSSWVTALLAVLDSAALFLALSPGSAPEVPARLCLRSGFVCFREVARVLGFKMAEEPDPDAPIILSYQEFLDAVERLRAVDFPIERDPADAWPDFVGWRVTYEQTAYAVATEVDAVPALWSGPRRHDDPAIPPTRPPVGHPLRAPDPKGMPPSTPDE